MGKVTGNIQCVDRLDIRSEGSLTGDIVTQRISIEDGAFLKGSVQVRASEHKHDKAQQQQSKALSTESGKPSIEQPKAASAVAGR
jgi:cytoskeletal protein CcmA (bactofilin family)